MGRVVVVCLITLVGALTGAAGAGAAVVAVIDSGVQLDHPALAGRILPGPDLVDGDRTRTDSIGHGTHIAGIVAPDAEVLAIRVLDARNEGTPADLARAIDAAVLGRADVVNLSLNAVAGSARNDAVLAALRRAESAGVVVIAAAGNDSLPACQEPATPFLTLCVGAVGRDFRLAPFSNYGRGLGLVAPGADVRSTWPVSGYRRLSGTSQAAAQVSAVAARLVDAGLRGSAVLRRLVATARDIGAPGYDARAGFGLLDADRALAGAAGRRPEVLRASSARRPRLADVRRHGLRVRCDAARPGICRVNLRVRGRTIATGRRRVSGAVPVLVTARATRAARSLRPPAAGVAARLEVALTGTPGLRRPIVLRP